MKTQVEFIPKTENCPLCGSGDIAPEFSLLFENHKIFWDFCKKCDLVFQNPRLSEKAIKNIYASDVYWGEKDIPGVSAYSRYCHNDHIRLRQSKLRLRKIMCITGIRSGKLLDIGCATGFFGFIAMKHGFQVTGVEPSAKMADFGRLNYNLNIQCATLEDSILEKDHYDIVTLWGTDSHFLNPRQGFEKIVSSLKPGGILVMNYQNFRHWIRLLFPGLKKSRNVIYNLSDTSMAFLLKELNLRLLYKSLEWQWIPVDHFFRLIKIRSPGILTGKVVFLPAISFPLIIAKKPL